MSALEKAGLAAAATFATVVLWNLPSFTVDDAFILFRYASNLAVHGELNWNVGEDPVEGYTGVALPVLLAGLQKGGVSLIPAVKAIGVAGFFLSAFVVYCFARVLGLAVWVRLTALFLYVGAPFLYPHAVAGLETTLYTAALLTSMFLLYRCLDTQGDRRLRQALLMLALLTASLTRPEGTVLAALCLLALVLEAFFVRRADWRTSAIVVALLYVLPAGVYFAARWKYYGQLLPNTFYVKVSRKLFYLESAFALESFLLFFVVPAVLAATLLAVHTDRSWALVRERHRSDRVAILALGAVSAAFTAAMAILYLRTNLVMNYSHRFFVPLAPILVLWIAFLLNAGWLAIQDSAADRPLRKRYVVGVTVGLLLLQVLVYARGFPDALRYMSWYGQMLGDEHVAVGRWLKENIPGSEWLVVHGDAGAVPYYSQLRTVDFGELNDENLVRLDLDERVDYFYSFNPGAAVITSYRRDELQHTEQAARITADPRFARYELVERYSSEARPAYHQFLFVREDLLPGR